MTLHARLRELFPAASNQTLKRMILAGRVAVNGVRAAKLSQPLAAGDVVRADAGPRPTTKRATLAPLTLVHEDADVLIVSKPPGLLTSTVPREPRPTALAIVKRYLEAADPSARAGLIHRLDRDAGGLLVFSKSDLAYRSLKTQFFNHSVDREYEAVVRGTVRPKKGRIESRLVERADGSVHSTRQAGRGQRAITEYQVIREDGELTTLRVTLQTGRKHQIRAHLSERGWPIVGDAVYGRRERGGLRLRAVRLAFDHPRTGERLAFRIAPS